MSTAFSSSAFGGGGGAVSAVANGANDRVTTFSSADALNGEANLTFNGSTLNVTGAVETTGDITSGGSFYASQFMYHTGDTNTKLQFTLDQINLVAGDVNMLKLKEDTQNECVFFEGGDDVDFRIEAASAAYFMYINSGENKMFIGGNTANKLTDHMFNVQDGNIALGRNSADAIGAEVIFAKSRHATDGSHTVVQDADILGEIAFKGSDGTNLESAAAITVQVDGTPGDNDMPGKIVMKTTQDGANTPSVALSINSTQNCIVERSVITKGTLDGTMGTDQFAAIDYSSSGGRFITTGTTTAIGTYQIVARSTDGSPTTVITLDMATNSNATFAGTVTQNSDLKLKENIEDLDDMTGTIKALRPVKFNRKFQPNDDNHTSATYFGFIAQEAQTILPDLIHKNPDVEFDGTPTGTETLSISYTEMIPILTKAIQELEARIAALEG